MLGCEFATKSRVCDPARAWLTLGSIAYLKAIQGLTLGLKSDYFSMQWPLGWAIPIDLLGAPVGGDFIWSVRIIKAAIYSSLFYKI
jgi:hypothetical protein